MNRIKTAAALAAAFAAAGAVSAAAYEVDIKVGLDGLVNGYSQMVNFDSFRPIQIDSSTFVPARTVAEAAGMTVEWDQPTQTALITLHADSYSDKPVERYGAELINQIGGYGLDLEPLNITAALKLNEKNAVIRYNFKDVDGDVVAIGKTIEMSNAAQLIDDAALIIPLRNAMELFGLDIKWYQESLTAEVSIPDVIVAPKGLQIIANHNSAEDIGNTYENYYNTDWYNGYIPDNSYNGHGYTDSAHGAYIGSFKITKYCPCEICNGGWGNNTAWAGKITPGQTVAVDPDIIGQLQWIYIDGYGLRRAEDCGGGVKGYHIDLAVPSHEEATNGIVEYKDVYFAAE